MNEKTSSSSIETSDKPDVDLTLAFLDDLSPQGWWDWRIQEDWEYISPKFWRFLGFDPEKKSHHPSEWKKLIDPEDSKLWIEEFEKHIQSKGKNPTGISKIVRYKKADGSDVYLVCQGKVIEWTPEGKPKRMVGTHTDVTQSVLDERRASELADLIQAAFEKSMHPCSIFSLDGRFTKVNKEFAGILGYTPEELLNKTWMEITHPDDLEPGNAILGRFLSGEIEEIEVEKRFVHKSGKFISTRVRAEILKPKNQPAYFLMHLKDLTLEIELMKSIKRLESIS